MNILYLGNFSFPYGNAAGSRVLGNGLLLRSLGHDVKFIGVKKKLNTKLSLDSTEKEYLNFKYYNFPYREGIRGRLNFNQFYKEIVDFIIKHNIEIVICYGSPTLSIFLYRLQKWCNVNKKKFIVDVVDLLPAVSGNILFKIIKSCDEFLLKKIISPKSDGIIAISSYLADYYRVNVTKVVIIPPLVNSERYNDLKRINITQSLYNIIYVGNPFPTDGRKVSKFNYKDRLDLIIEVLYELNDPKVVFNIYGLTKEMYLNILPEHARIIELCKDNIIFNGPVSNELAIQKISESDFTILLRDINTMTKAGFPTKFVESISCGTPMITNLTSDLYLYIEDGINGFVINSLELDSLVKNLRSIFSTDKTKIDKMKKYSLQSQLFSYRNYQSQMNDFINKL
ncbi:glycosyltransferase [Chryseobacterium indoltheticum]|uniref:glycosyltransferase n=1 Tax=Chryseobacterium indoltheticum TaxID=254 RepID=UPI0019120909|nr:glycosyltransferase [Chryseobacterium indoltheticum]QQQ28053.1 glycosyltransferase [Chryseobacterium indoltheticum]